jgi:tol-pal system protein YbgF
VSASGLYRWYAVGIISGLTATPLVAADREHQQIAADIRMLQEQTQQVTLAIAALSQVLKSVVARLDQQSEEQAVAALKAFANQKILLDSMGGDLRVIRERSDETNVRISELDQEIEALRSAMPPPGSFLQPALDLPELEHDEQALPEVSTPSIPPPLTAGVSPRRMMDQSFADYTSGQYTLAIQGYEAFLRTFPTSEQADDAQFMIGESHFADRNNLDAVAAYSDVIKRFPTANTAPDAYYKRGLALERLDSLDGARESWQQVVKVFPETDAGRLAKQGLDRLAARKP